MTMSNCRLSREKYPKIFLVAFQPRRDQQCRIASKDFAYC